MLSLQKSTGNSQGLKTQIWELEWEADHELQLPGEVAHVETQKLGISWPRGAQKTRLCQVENRSHDACQNSNTAELRPLQKCGLEIFALAEGGDEET